MAEERAVTTTTYDAKDGQQVTLTFETITKYLVQGHAEYVTRQEMMYFMGICKSRGLNPFAKDCYLIKYSQKDGAAIVTAIDYFRKRAKAQRDCKGWSKGVIVERKGEVVYSNGLVLEGDKLLGGWFQGQPEGWTDPLKLEVNLKGYIKRTKDGAITKFWSDQNQPSQIAKVAESQGLRTLWPDEFQQLYTQEELGEADTFKTVGEALKESEEDIAPLVKQFDNTIGKLESVNQDNLNAYLSKSADHFGKSIEEIKSEAIKDFDGFWKQFKVWEKSQPKESSPEDAALRAEFTPLRSQFPSWFWKNIERIKAASPAIKKELEIKWNNSKACEGQAFPSGEPSETIVDKATGEIMGATEEEQAQIEKNKSRVSFLSSMFRFKNELKETAYFRVLMTRSYKEKNDVPEEAQDEVLAAMSSELDAQNAS